MFHNLVFTKDRIGLILLLLRRDGQKLSMHHNISIVKEKTLVVKGALGKKIWWLTCFVSKSFKKIISANFGYMRIILDLKRHYT